MIVIRTNQWQIEKRFYFNYRSLLAFMHQILKALKYLMRVSVERGTREAVMPSGDTEIVVPPLESGADIDSLIKTKNFNVNIVHPKTKIITLSRRISSHVDAGSKRRAKITNHRAVSINGLAKFFVCVSFRPANVALVDVNVQR